VGCTQRALRQLADKRDSSLALNGLATGKSECIIDSLIDFRVVASLRRCVGDSNNALVSLDADHSPLKRQHRGRERQDRDT